MFLSFRDKNLTQRLCRKDFNLIFYLVNSSKLKQRDEFYSAVGNCVLMKRFIIKTLIE